MKTGYYKLKVNTNFHKKGDIVFINEYKKHNGGQLIMKSGHWFKPNQVIKIDKCINCNKFKETYECYHCGFDAADVDIY